MAIIIRQLRALVTEAPLRQKKSSAEPKHSHCRKSLTVKISKDPPHVVYFERDTLEDSFECIFDPQVHHDEEKDHPDLAEYERRKALKPWQKDRNCPHHSNFFSRVRSSFSGHKFLQYTSTASNTIYA